MLQVLAVTCFANGIKVPVDNDQESHGDDPETTDDGVDRSDPTKITPVYYINDDEDNVDSYLIPPNPHRLEQVLPDVIVTPATYLLPPTPGKHLDYYYNPTEPAQQTDWYPIAQAPQQEHIPIYLNINESDAYPNVLKFRKAKAHERDRNTVPVPSLELEPPKVDAPNDYLVPKLDQEDFSVEDTRRPTKVLHENQNYDRPIVGSKKDKINYRTKVEPTLALHLLPPEPEFSNSKIPTKLYPKKYGSEFKPVPIPIAQYADDSASKIPRARPAKLLKPLPSTETDYLTPSDEKINYLYRKAEHKRKLKGEEIRQVS